MISCFQTDVPIVCENQFTSRRYGKPMPAFPDLVRDTDSKTPPFLRQKALSMVTYFSEWLGWLDEARAFRRACGGANNLGGWAIERFCPTQRLLREPPLHSGYCQWEPRADTLSIRRPSPEPTPLPCSYPLTRPSID